MRNVACMCCNLGCIFERWQGIHIWKWESSSLISDKTKGNMRKWGCKKNQLIFFPLPAFWDLCTAHPSLHCLGAAGKAESIHSYWSSSGWGYGSVKCSYAYCPVCESISSWWLLCLSLAWNNNVFVRRTMSKPISYSGSPLMPSVQPPCDSAVQE